MNNNDWDTAETDIAVIGMACRFPGAPDVQTFWVNLTAGVESISLLDASQAASANSAYRNRPNFRAAAGVLSDIEQFDAGFFGYSAREAEIMDPQQRLFLECAWEAFEDAGLVPHQCEGLVGVYAGCGINTYLINNVHPGRGHFSNRTFLESVQDFQLLLGNQSDFLSTRVSYKLDLRGPSINLQAACSTSLVAVHLACQSLILGECDMALAGCSTLRVPQDGGYLHEEGMVFSPDGHTRAFDANAEGTTFGSGVAAVLLKPLKAALTDGDVIHAIIKGSAVNNDGAHKLGFTAPSIDGQAAVIREALVVADVEPGSIGYIEAHGTGTPLGDPIEVAALKQAFGALPPNSCAIGTVKTNIGHLSWSAGMAGLIKTVLALKNAQIPPSLHYQSPNPRAQLEGSPLRVNERLVDWPERHDTPRRAGVSAFGVGGTNAHIVLQEPPPRRPRHPAANERPWHVLTLSAKCETALTELQERYLRFLDECPDLDLADLCHTANTGRGQHAHRCAVAAASVGMLRTELAQLAEDRAAMANTDAPAPVTAPPRLGFLFTGQGAQYLGMGRQLYDTEASFRQTLQQCDQILKDLGLESILEVIYPGSPNDRRLHDVALTQTAMFCIEYALAKLWMSWGVEPAVVMGHSTGEYAAACIAGVFSLEDGLLLCAERGRLFKEMVPADGLMASVSAPEADVLAALAPYPHAMSIAAVNGPLSTVISGRRSAVETVCAALAASGIATKVLEVQRAGHSPLTERMLGGLNLAASRIKLRPPRIPIVSNLTGRLAGDEIATPSYWCRHTREAVLFSRGMRCLADMGIRNFLEIGPDAVLLGMGAYCMLSEPAEWIPSLRRPLAEDGTGEDWRHMSNALARLYGVGVDIDWLRVDQGRARQRVSLPTYPFQRSRHWIDVSPTVHEVTLPADTAWTRGLLQVQWVQQDLPTPARRDGQAGGTWLLLADTGGLAERLRDRLAAMGEHSHLAYAAANYESFDGGTALRADTLEHFTRLLSSFDSPLKGVVNLWPCDIEPATQWRSGTEALRAAWQSCEGMLELAKALVARTSGTPLRVVVVTRAARATVPGDSLEGIGSAPLWAMVRVMGMEHPELHGLRIDLDSRRREDDAERLLSELLGPTSNDAVALRGELRFVERLVRAHSAQQPTVPAIRCDGAYLITGGLGGVGLLLASWLVDHGARHLLLLGRQAPGLEAAASIAQMVEKGARIQVLRADVANADALRRALSEAEGHPTLRGVFHAAGIVDDAVLMQQDRERFLAVLAPKVAGAWNLHRLCLRRAPQLEHFVLFSSAASLIGNAGQANHAAANAFLDALAHHRRALGEPALSINWGAWSEVGELRKNTTARQRVERLGFDPIRSQDGLRALAHGMTQQQAQLGMSPMDWSKFLPAFSLQGIGFYAAFAAAAHTPQRRGAALAVRLSSAEPSARAALLLEHVRSQAAQVLGLRSSDPSQPAIDDDRRLAEYGLDSLSAIELRNSLQADLNQPLPAMLVMDCPTVHEIAQHLAGLNFDVIATSVAELAPTTRPTAEAHDAPHELSMQQRRWLSLIRSGYGARVVPVVFYAELDEYLFRRALESVVSQHELLRYAFPSDRVQVLPPGAVLPSSDRLFADLSGLDDAQRSTALAAAVRQCWDEMPDPAVRPSWDIRCLKYPDGCFLLLLSLQHLDFDGTSLTTFVTELRVAYRALLRGLEPPKTEVAPYREYVQSQKVYMNDAIREDRAFFQGLYATLQRTTTLPRHPGFERTIPHESARYTALVPAGLWARVQASAGNLGVTSFSILMAAYARLIGELTASAEVVIAMIANGRPNQRFKATIGPFTAPFPVKVSTASLTLPELSLQCHRTVASITARSHYPVSDLVTSVPAFKGFPIDSYFTDVGINFTNYRREEDGEAPRARVIEVLGPVVEPEFVAANTEELRRIPGLHLVLDIFENELRPNFWYHAARFSQAQVAGWAERYVLLLCECVGTGSHDAPSPPM